MDRITFYENGQPCYREKRYSEFHGGMIDAVVSGGPIATTLAAYEDTGLTPSRAFELGAADREGRILILDVPKDRIASVMFRYKK